MDCFRESKRARRRRERLNAIARVERFLRNSTFGDRPGQPFVSFRDENGIVRRFETWEDVFAWRRLHARRRHAQRKPCSCWMCGNPRRHLGEVTLQERRQNDSLRDEE